MTVDTGRSSELRAAIGGGPARRSFWARALRAGLWTLLINLGAAAVAVLALAGAPQAIVLTAGLALVAALCLRTPWAELRSVHSAALVGLWAQARVLLLVAVGVLATARDDAVSAWLPAALCLGATAAESTIRATCESGYPVSANLPGAPAGRAPRTAPNLVPAAALGCLVLLGAAVAAGRTGWWTVVPALATAGLAAAVFGQATLRVRDRQRAERRLAKDVAQYAPDFAVHWHAPAGTAYQIAMWLPYLERLGRRFLVVVRSEDNFREVLRLTGAPVVMRRTQEELDPVVPESLRVVFYVNTATVNAHLIRYSRVHHVQLNHGDSDKIPSYSPAFRLYDHDFVAGQAAIDRFAANGVRMPPDAFTIVGRPQLEDVEVAAGPIGGLDRRTVLYAPTWAGFYADSNYSSLHLGGELVEELLRRGCTVIFRPHPYSRRTARYARACAQIIARLERDRAATGRAHVSGDDAERRMTVTDCFNASDALISDVSSIAADYLFSGKPMAMVAVTHPPEEFVRRFPLAEAAYVIDGTGDSPGDPGGLGGPGGLGQVFDDLLHADPKEPTRRRLRTYYLGDIPVEDYAGRFLQEASRLFDAEGGAAGQR